MAELDELLVAANACVARLRLRAQRAALTYALHVCHEQRSQVKLQRWEVDQLRITAGPR
jgi:hypothetical protein